MSKACIDDIATPPTSSLTKVGGPDEYFQDYSLTWSKGVCINIIPLPSDCPTYHLHHTIRMPSAQAPYVGQVSRA